MAEEVPTTPEAAAATAAAATPMASRTTAEQDLRTASQREINLIWENTQMKVALSVVWSALAAALTLAVFGKVLGTSEIQLAAVVFLFGVANLVTGFYFGRTNHARIGDDPKELDSRR